ncbi:MAG: ABC transporter ATP-binding protein [Euryarchaeota archaeon]|nr:ABC transporter ATP-binding protein [Euryarchaeota archaeon]
MPEYAIQTFNLSKKYFLKKEIVALDNVSLEISKGELFGLLGPNGSGKTTLIKILCTLIEPTEGKAFVNGYDVMNESLRVRKSVGFVSTENTLYYKLTAFENLEYYASLYKVPKNETKKRIEELLELVGLTSRADDLVERYSSGMRQRLSIIRSLIHSPDILFLDEPTLGLDIVSAKQIRTSVKNFSKERECSIILSTHDFREAGELSDRIGILSNGKIVAADKIENLKKQFETTSLEAIFEKLTSEA